MTQAQAHIDRYNMLLANNYIVYTVVDADLCSGLPTHLKGNTCLAVGLNLRLPIPDLSVDTFGIAGTMSFGGRRHYVAVPWHALLGCGTEENSPVPRWAGAALPPMPDLAPAAAAPRRCIAAVEGNIVRVDFRGGARAGDT